MTQDLELRKSQLINELYLTGCIDGIAHKTAQRKGNPIRTYISSCMYKQRIKNSPELVDDCYNEAFVHLQKMPAEKLVAMYNENPVKILATALRIIALKCFAQDPRYQNPKHSLMQSLMYASAVRSTAVIGGYEMSNGEIEFYSDIKRNTYSYIPTTLDDNKDEFEHEYGFNIECLIRHLSPTERKLFYDMTETGKARKPIDKDKKKALIKKILKIKQTLA